MKGIVFTELLGMVESVFGEDMVDDVIDEAVLPSNGAYTAVGTYDHREVLAIVGALSERTGVPAPDLVRAFGKYLFERFTTLYPSFFEGVTSSFDFLHTIEQHVHVEVQKLYPEAQLPSFETRELAPGRMEMRYRSERPFVALAHGLILAASEHFGETVEVAVDDQSDASGARAVFQLSRQVTVS